MHEKIEEEKVEPTSSFSYIVEQARKQLNKKPVKSNVKIIEEDSEPSEYSEDDNIEINADEELLGVVKFVEIMGFTFSKYKSYVKSLSTLFLTQGRESQSCLIMKARESRRTSKQSKISSSRTPKCSLLIRTDTSLTQKTQIIMQTRRIAMVIPTRLK